MGIGSPSLAAAGEGWGGGRLQTSGGEMSDSSAMARTHRHPLTFSTKTCISKACFPRLQHRIRRLLAVIIIAFLVLLVWQSYWHLCKSDWLFAQQTNRRLERIERATPRGRIFDRTGAKLAWSEHGRAPLC